MLRRPAGLIPILSMAEGAGEPSKAPGMLRHLEWVCTLEDAIAVLHLVVVGPDTHLLDQSESIERVRFVRLNSAAPAIRYLKAAWLCSKRVAVCNEPVFKHAV